MLLQHGANPRNKDQNGKLPLYVACENGSVSATYALVKHMVGDGLIRHDYFAGKGLGAAAAASTGNETNDSADDKKVADETANGTDNDESSKRTNDGKAAKQLFCSFPAHDLYNVDAAIDNILEKVVVGNTAILVCLFLLFADGMLRSDFYNVISAIDILETVVYGTMAILVCLFLLFADGMIGSGY